MKKFLSIAALMILLVALCTGCGGVTYKHLTHDEAKKMIAENPNVIIVDVRTQEEYDNKHIPNAVLIPIDDLKAGDFSKLPDKNATILTYCWTGRRAEDASKILADKGYKNVYEFGGIIDWTGEFEGVEIATVKHITHDEAREILASNPNAILIDCRFPKDYENKHIVGAVFVPKEAVMAGDFSKIPDKDASIICYCGDGNRARQTSKLLVEKGYKNVYEMGGIIDWTGPVEGTEVE